MRIRLTGKDVIITDQLRTYVEYRLFTSVARYQALIRGLNVTLGHNPGNGGRFLCIVAVDLGVLRKKSARPNFQRNRPMPIRFTSARRAPNERAAS
jgi:ribosome-associated translation inhibitor RaiA